MQDRQPITIDEIIKYLEESLLIAPGRITPGTALKTLGDWDSMGMMAFIGLIEDRIGIRFRVRDLVPCESPESFLALIHERSRSRTETT